MEEISVSYSELSSARQCPLKHQLEYVERWRKEPTPGGALDFGTRWHEVMEAHYGAIQEHQQEAIADGREWHDIDADDTASVAIERAFEKINATEDEEIRDKLAWMYKGYYNHWGIDPHWKIVAIEYAGETPLPQLLDRVINIKYRIDLVVKDLKGHLWVVDHKSCADLPKDAELELDDQLGLYTWALVSLGKDIFGQHLNYTRKNQLKRPMTYEERFYRPRTYRTEKQLDTTAREAYLEAYNMYANHERAQMLGVEAPRATDTQRCRFRCDYTESCLAGRKGIDLRQHLKANKFYQDWERH